MDPKDPDLDLSRKGIRKIRNLAFCVFALFSTRMDEQWIFRIQIWIYQETGSESNEEKFGSSLLSLFVLFSIWIDEK